MYYSVRQDFKSLRYGNTWNIDFIFMFIKMIYTINDKCLTHA